MLPSQFPRPSDVFGICLCHDGRRSAICGLRFIGDFKVVEASSVFAVLRCWDLEVDPVLFDGVFGRGVLVEVWCA
ncbi:MAG: hypothetical protein ACOYCB_14005 [Fastidiosipilaceae bacterium]